MPRDIREFGLEPDPVIEAYKKDVDRTMIRETIKWTVTQRLQALEQMRNLREAFLQSRKRLAK